MDDKTVFVVFKEEAGAYALFIEESDAQEFIDLKAGLGYYYDEVPVDDVHEYI